MSESVGKKLHDTRVKRGLSVEEVAHATKLRPDKIHALEHEDYTQFANNAYARGFLQIYGRYLGVNVTESLESLDTTNQLSVADYQYLTNGIQQREPERATFSFSHKKQTPSIVPLVVFAALLVLGFMGFQLYVNWQRVTSDAELSKERNAAEDESKVTVQMEPVPGPKPPAAVAPTSIPAEPPPIPRAEPVTPAVPVPGPVAVAPVMNEVLVEPIKKTWITVRRDDPKSAPVFEDYLYPDARPLKVKGASIYIDARDPSAILIRKNGTPIAYAPNAEIR
jgi:cytoskeletal protein RodZ